MLFALIAPQLQATSIYTATSHKIDSLTFMSHSEPYEPAWAGVVQVSFATDIPWTVPGLCDTRTVALHPDDAHLISLVLAAYSTDKPIKIYADSTQKVTSNYCFLRAISY